MNTPIGPGLSKKQIGTAAAVFLAVILFSKCIVVVPAGHVGVKDLFGTVYDKALHSGINMINPLLKIHKMSVRTQQLSETATVPSKEGLTVNIDLSILFSLDPKQASQVYKNIGPK